MHEPVAPSAQVRRWAFGITVAAAFAVVATFLPGESLELRSETSLLRMVTCHFTHWNSEQLAWDVLAFTALGLACARRNARATYATLLASVFVIPMAVLAFAPEIGAYRGLSGLASAMFAMLLTLERRRLTWSVVTFAILFAAKLTFEAITGGAVFANDLGDHVVAVPVAHLAGALVGVIGGFQSGKLVSPVQGGDCRRAGCEVQDPMRAGR